MSETNKDNYLRKLFIDDVKGMLGGDGGGNSGSGGSSGGGIVTVDALPTEGDASVIYRMEAVANAELYYHKSKWELSTVYVVDTLPETGEKARGEKNYISVYYNPTDGSAKGYVDSELSTEMGVPVGWYDAATLFQAIGFNYGGDISSLDEATDSGAFYILVTKTTNLYHYCDGEFSRIITSDNFEFDESTGTLVLNL